MKKVGNKEGYKETKIGWIPEEWKEVRFGDIPDKDVKWSITGGPFGSDLKSSDYTEKGVRILQLQNLGDGRFIDKYKIYTSEKKADSLIACNIYPQEIILSKMGDPVARACFIPSDNERYLMASDGIRLVPDESKFDKKFVLEYINFSIFRKLAIRNSTGSTRQRIGLTDLKKLPFVLPPLPEQKKIAQILTTWDTAIEKTEALLSQLRLRKQGLMQRLLSGEQRLKGFVGEWEEVRLGEVLEDKPKYGINAPAVEFSEYLPRYLRITDIGDHGEFLEEKRVSVDDKDYRNFILKINDIVFARTGNTTGKSYLYNLSDGELVYAGFLIKVTPNIKKLNPKYLKFYTETEKYWSWVKTMSARSGQPGINGKEYSSMPLSIPPLKEQTAIATILTQADAEIEKTEVYLSKLQTQKKGLMQQLLTGQRRVKLN